MEMAALAFFHIHREVAEYTGRFASTTLKGTVKVCADDDDEIAQTAKVNFEFIYNHKKALSKCLDCYQKTYHSHTRWQY